MSWCERGRLVGCRGRGAYGLELGLEQVLRPSAPRRPPALRLGPPSPWRLVRCAGCALLGRPPVGPPASARRACAPVSGAVFGPVGRGWVAAGRAASVRAGRRFVPVAGPGGPPRRASASSLSPGPRASRAPARARLAGRAFRSLGTTSRPSTTGRLVVVASRARRRPCSAGLGSRGRCRGGIGSRPPGVVCRAATSRSSRSARHHLLRAHPPAVSARGEVCRRARIRPRARRPRRAAVVSRTSDPALRVGSQAVSSSTPMTPAQSDVVPLLPTDARHAWRARQIPYNAVMRGVALGIGCPASTSRRDARVLMPP